MSQGEELQKPPSMPRELFKKIKQAHDEGSQVDQTLLVELLDRLTKAEGDEEETEPSGHPAEAEFAELIELDKWEPEISTISPLLKLDSAPAHEPMTAQSVRKAMDNAKSQKDAPEPVHRFAPDDKKK